MQKLLFILSLSLLNALRPNFVVIVRVPRIETHQVNPSWLLETWYLLILIKVTDAFDGRIVENKAYKDIVDLENISKSRVLRNRR